MYELIDYCNIDPMSGKHLYQLTVEEKKALLISKLYKKLVEL